MHRHIQNARRASAGFPACIALTAGVTVHGPTTARGLNAQPTAPVIWFAGFQTYRFAFVDVKEVQSVAAESTKQRSAS